MPPGQTTHFHTMSNLTADNNTILALLRGTLQLRATTTTVFKTVYVGSNRLPVSILEMFPLSAKAWQKTSSFDSIATALCTHVENPNVSDLLNVVTMEVPLDTTTVHVEADAIEKMIPKNVLDVYNLDRFLFLNSAGNITKTPRLPLTQTARRTYSIVGSCARLMVMNYINVWSRNLCVYRSF